MWPFAAGFCRPMARCAYKKNGRGDYRRMAGKRMVISLMAAMGVCIFMLCLQGLNDRVFPADAAVVLGCEVYADGTLSPRLQARVDMAYGLYYYGTVKKIIVSGGTGKSGFNEAVAMRGYLVAHGVPPGDVIVDENGVNTRATAKFTAEYAKGHGWERVIAVSQFYHIPRTVLSLKHEGVPVVGSLGTTYFEPSDVFSVMREVPAYFAYWSAIK